RPSKRSRHLDESQNRTTESRGCAVSIGGTTMEATNLEGIELIRIVRADGNLTLASRAQPGVQIDGNIDPSIARDGATAEISFRSNASIAIPSGVAVEVVHCAGNLDVENLDTPLTLGRISGNFRARAIGALTIRHRIDGNARIERAGAIEGGEVAGVLRVEKVRSVLFETVAGSFEARDIEIATTIERIAGNAFVERLGGTLRVRKIGGRLLAEKVGEVDVETVGGKAKVIESQGNVRIGRVGGRFSVDGIRGDVRVDRIGGHPSAFRGTGDVEPAQVLRPAH